VLTLLWMRRTPQAHSCNMLWTTEIALIFWLIEPALLTGLLAGRPAIGLRTIFLLGPGAGIRTE
jgi:hypothetical protein